MVSASDGSAFTGSVTVAVTGDGGTQATGSVGSGACTHEGNGFHTYVPAQAETNYDHVAFTFTGTGAIPATVQVYTTFPQTGDNFARLGAPAGASLSADVAAVKAQTAAIETDTQDIQSRLPAALVSGRMDSNVQAMANNVLTAAAINADAITAAKLAADVTTELQSGLATAAALATVDGIVDTIVATTDKLDDTLEDDGGTYRFTTNALEQAPSGGGSLTANDVWTHATRTLTALDEDSTTLDLDATIRGAVGLSAADLDTQLSTIDDYLDTEMAAALAAVDTEVAAIKAKTDNLPAAPAATGDIPTAVQNADALLGRNVAGGSSAGRLVKEALYVLRNKTEIASGTLTVFGTDDATPAFTADVVTTAGDPISSVDPS